MAEESEKDFLRPFASLKVTIESHAKFYLCAGRSFAVRSAAQNKMMTANLIVDIIYP